MDPVNGRLPAYMMDLARCSVQKFSGHRMAQPGSRCGCASRCVFGPEAFSRCRVGAQRCEAWKYSCEQQSPRTTRRNPEVKLIDAGAAGRRLGKDYVKSFTPEHAHPLQKSLEIVYAFYDWYSLRKTIVLAESSDLQRAGLTHSQIPQKASESLANEREFVLEAA